MNRKELAEMLGVSENSIKSNFKRTAESFAKKGIIITKSGRGETATYTVDYTEDHRADTLYNEEKNDIILGAGTINTPAWEFLVFLAIATTPMLVFRGSYRDFLEYIQNPITPEGVKNLKDALEALSERDVIMYKVDKTDESYFVASIYRKVEEETRVGISMVRECKKLQEEYNKRSWVPLLKTWIGVQMLSKHQPYTYSDLSAITGLSVKTLIDNSKILEKSQIFKTTKSYISYNMCIGKNVDLNGFYEGNRNV